MSFEFPAPSDPTPLMQENLRQRLAIMNRPSPMETIAPAIGGAVKDISGGYFQGKKNRSVQQANQDAGTYIAALHKGTQISDDDHARGARALLTLGITPPELKEKPLTTIQAESAARAAGSASAKPPKPAETEDNKLVRIEKEAAARARGAGTTDKFNQGEWDKINRMGNPNVAPRGSLLGIAGQNNARADRALSNLNDPKMVVQQLEAVTTDVAGIMQNGSPHESGIAGQSFGNVLTRWAALKSQLTSTPTSINNPATVAKLKQIVNDIKRIDNKIISDNLKTLEISSRATISKDKPRWEDFKKSVYETTTAPGESAPTGGKSPAQMTDDEIKAYYAH